MISGKKIVRVLVLTALLISLLPVSVLPVSLLPTSLLPAWASASTDQFTAQFVPGAGVSLDTNLYLPAKTPAPAILLAHGLGGNKDSVAKQAIELAKAGFVVLTWSARGFGKSTGEISMDSVKYEVKDGSRLIDYLASRKEVSQDKKGPIVGVVGSSYGGAFSLMLGATDPRVRAVSADITWNNLQSALFPQGAQGVSAPGPFKKTWAGTLFNLIAIQNSYLGECGNFSADWCNAFKSAAVNGEISAQSKKLLADSSPANFLQNLTAPTLLMQGEDDSLFPLSESQANLIEIKKYHPNTPVSLIWHTGGHDGGIDESSRLNQLTLNWMNKYLNKQAINFPEFQVTDAQGAISITDSSVLSQIWQSKLLPENQFTSTIPLANNLSPILAPTGGIPAAISALPGIGSAGNLANTLLNSGATAGIGANPLSGGTFASFLLPGQSSTFPSPIIKKQLLVVGSSKIRVHVTSTKPDLTLFFSLIRESSNGTQIQPSGLISPVKISKISTTGIDLNLNLPAVFMKVNPGDRLALTVSATDQGFLLPNDGRLYTVSPISALTYPTLPLTLIGSSNTNISWIIVAIIFLAIAFLSLYTLGRKARRNKSENSDETSLIKIDQLSKIYQDGYRAVHNLSFDIKVGKVVGLLGPNGAGKTTTLRMLMGLIYPTGGSIWINGKKVFPGSDSLAQIGALVEGPGFLPHLSGIENLNLYWKSIGRSDDPKLAEVLEVTKLGSAVNKKVRTYSQGMRQRLAIAQAMLGLPQVLILDEPTNGLDPQQIVEMREVLKEYAKGGRTVLISSHILAEIQQICTDVIVMHRGELVISGEIDSVIGEATSLEEVFLKVIGNDLIIGKEPI